MQSVSENRQWITMFGEKTMRIEAPRRDLRQVAFCYRRAQAIASWSYGTVSLQPLSLCHVVPLYGVPMGKGRSLM